MTQDDPINVLRAALKVSPNNLPLRQHLAATLLAAGRFEEAQREFQDALSLSPRHAGLKLGLAETFARMGKTSAAMVIIEELLALSPPPAGVFLLQARMQLAAGDLDAARESYTTAIVADADLADAVLAKRLGLAGFGQQADAQTDDDQPGYGGGDDMLSAGSAFAVPDDQAGEADDDDDDDGDDEEDEVGQPEVDAAGRVRMGSSSGGRRKHPMERPKIDFAGVGGMDGVKEEIRVKIIHPLTHADLYKAYGKAIGGGILMYGPPGCGKTHLARATAGEVKAAFISVGINDVLDMWMGNSERNLHDLFEQARQNSPCVLFFDEVDALGASRSDMRQSAGRQLINQFLSELDGVKSSNDGVLILAATNAPWHLDTAFRRPGRFDRVLFVPPPDVAARASILEILLKGKPTEGVDCAVVAKKCDDFSGADLKAVVDTAVEAKLREAIKAGLPSPLTTKDLQAAAKKLKSTTGEWFATARNHALYANQGGVYDDILAYLKMQ